MWPYSPHSSLTFKMAEQEDKPKAVALMSLNATKAGMQAVDKKTVRFSFLSARSFLISRNQWIL